MIFEHTLWEYFLFLIVFLILIFVFGIFRDFLAKYLKKIFSKTSNKYDDFIVEQIGKSRKIFYYFISFYLPFISFFSFEKAEEFLKYIFILVVVIEVAKIFSSLINFVESLLQKKNQKDKHAKTAYNAISKVLKILVWIFAFLFLFSNWGIDITALVAGLGIGGIAIAFAFQSILKDLFAYLSILLDAPIDIGDYVEVENSGGWVKKIGIKTTRLLGAGGEELIISNDKLVSGILDNSGKRSHRRFSFKVGAAYGTKTEKLKKIRTGIEEIIKSEKDVEFIRCHLKDMSDFSLDFHATYKVEDQGYNHYMDIRERINLSILELFEKEGVEIPFPTQTQYNREG